ncbi:universal stress protein [Archaeoglobus veneficus]|uniref:universal stress protein n=1 Tax=Archaeoglobus veneficus TaxID=58290 RepID=UPI0018DE0017|nr:universal stress protein [Archaeoglobus veneficus]
MRHYLGEVIRTFDKVLYATDFSRHSENIVDVLVEYGGVIEEVVAVRVVNINRVKGSVFSNVNGWVSQERAVSEENLSKLVDNLRQHGVRARYYTPIPVGDPATEIVKVAEDEKVSLIITGSRGRSTLKTILLGSVAEGVLRRAGVPVIVFKGESADIFDRILYVHYPLDISSETLDYVKCAARAGGREVVILYTIEPQFPIESINKKLKEMQEKAEEAVNSVKQELEKVGIDTRVLI